MFMKQHKKETHSLTGEDCLGFHRNVPPSLCRPYNTDL